MDTLWKNLRRSPVLRLLAAIQVGLLVLSPNLVVRPRQAVFTPSGNTPRRVNIPYFSSDVAWDESAIFWFGKNELSLPGRNYADVRVAYTADALQVRVTVVDYYLWYDGDPHPEDDLTQNDAVAIYLDTHHDRVATPQSDDYTFLVGARFWEDISQYLRQGRGTGLGWDNTWAATWSGELWMQWLTGGPNDNGGTIDFGWVGGYTIPWSVLGLSGPPDEGTVWGFGVMLYDRDDQPPAGYVAPEYWPEIFQLWQPSYLG